MDIATVLGVLRRRALLILLSVAVGAAAAYLISLGQEPVYSASTELLLRGAPANAAGGGSGATPTGAEFGAPLPESSADRETVVLSGPLLERVEERLTGRLGEDRAAAAVRSATATAASESEVVTITAQASQPKAAALVANTIAQENIAYRRETSVAKIRRALRTVDRELATLGRADTPRRLTTVQGLEQRAAALRQAASLQTGDADILRRAVAPPSPTSPLPARNALIGGFAGLLIGIGIALVREQLDRRLKDPKGLETAIGLPVLADVPKSRALASKDGQASAGLPAREAEAFQMLRANLRYVNAERQLRSVLVTSAGVGDGKSTVAVNLAKADASTGARVLLIDADVRRPRVAELLGVPSDGGGLSAYVTTRDAKLADVVNRIPVTQRANGAGASQTMDVLIAGEAPPNPTALIDSERMRELIREAEDAYDLVVIDTSPAAIVSDAISLMAQVSAVIVVGRMGSTTTREADNLREQLERVDAPVFGAVANFSGGGPAYYGYGGT